MNIPVSIEVDRFDVAFDQMEAGELPRLKQTYPFLFPEKYSDSVWLANQADTLQQSLRAEVQSVFPVLEPYRTELELLFKHVRFYFPQIPIPKVITLTNNVNYEKRVVLADTLLLIGLDNYLGSEHEFYAGLPNYISKELDPELLVSDVGSALSRRLVPTNGERSFIARMIYYGKGLYLKDRLMPLASDFVKIRYTKDELQWARENEGQIWRYFIEGELLYNTEQSLGPRFLDPAPFSKFRLVLDNESPGRIGRYMGWQIVRSFMEANDSDLYQMLEMPGEELFKRSNYKPPK